MSQQDTTEIQPPEQGEFGSADEPAAPSPVTETQVAPSTPTSPSAPATSPPSAPPAPAQPAQADDLGIETLDRRMPHHRDYVVTTAGVKLADLVKQAYGNLFADTRESHDQIQTQVLRANGGFIGLDTDKPLPVGTYVSLPAAQLRDQHEWTRNDMTDSWNKQR